LSGPYKNGAKQVAIALVKNLAVVAAKVAKKAMTAERQQESMTNPATRIKQLIVFMKKLMMKQRKIQITQQRSQRM
jgi:hypothetical protein